MVVLPRDEVAADVVVTDDERLWPRLNFFEGGMFAVLIVSAKAPWP